MICGQPSKQSETGRRVERFKFTVQPLDRHRARRWRNGPPTLSRRNRASVRLGDRGWIRLERFADREVNDTALKARTKAGGLTFYAVGKEDFVMPMAPPFRQILADSGIKYSDIESVCGHTWINGRAHLEQIARLLFN